MTNFPHGVSSYGVPVLPSVGGGITTGNVFFVDSGNVDGDDSPNAGKKQSIPFSTIDYAVGKCTENNGDVIIVMPGHAETVSAAGGLALDVAGITIVGVGQGSDTPTVTLDTADTADVDVDAANITIENIHFKSGFEDVAVCIDVNSTDCTIRGCRFTEAANDENFLVCIQTGTTTISSGLTVEGCYVLQDDAANTHFINVPGTPKGDIYRSNIIIGDFGTMAIGGAGVCTFCTVMGNVIYNAATTVDGCINFAATATGICMDNKCGGAAAQANGITATAFAIAENYYGVLSEDLSGILDPIAT